MKSQNDIDNNKHKMLLVTPFFPYPPIHGGKIRQFNLLKNISHSWDITIVSLTYPDEYISISTMKKYCAEIKTFLFNRRTLNLFQRIFSLVPELFYPYRSKEFQKFLGEILKEGNFDILQIEYLFMAQNIRADWRIKRAVTVHEPHSLLCLRKSLIEHSFLKKMHFFIQFLKSTYFEKKMLKKFDVCFSCSTKDKKLLERRHSRCRVFEVPNGVDVEYYKFSLNGFENGSIVFIGAMDTYPNIDAAEFFCDNILPLVKKEISAVKFYIGGNNPTEKVKRLGMSPNVVVTGFLRDIRNLILRAHVIVVPIRVGGGTRLKILEAMAVGRPVVSSRIGCEGIDVTNEKDILIADTPSDFAAAIIRLMKDEQLWKSLAENGRQLVQNQYDWKIISKKLNNYLIQSNGKEK